MKGNGTSLLRRLSVHAVVGELAVFISGCPGVRAQTPESDKLQEYLRLAEETLRNPIRPPELEEAVLSDHGVTTIAGLFEKSVRVAISVNGQVVTPELGGEVTLDDGELVFAEYPDPGQEVIRGMVDRKDDPVALLDFLNGSARGREVLKETGGLHALLYKLSQSNPAEPTVAERALLGQAVGAAVAIHYKTWSIEPEVQRQMIEQNEWRGRYLGFWHIHPPRLDRSGNPMKGIEPSLQDMSNAIELGQFVTIVFQPQGFDFYDLSPLADAKRVDFSQARVIRHRSTGWGQHFQRLFNQVRGR